MTRSPEAMVIYSDGTFSSKEVIPFFLSDGSRAYRVITGVNEMLSIFPSKGVAVGLKKSDGRNVTEILVDLPTPPPS
jgi:hypothetical protein